MAVANGNTHSISSSLEKQDLMKLIKALENQKRAYRHILKPIHIFRRQQQFSLYEDNQQRRADKIKLNYMSEHIIQAT